VADDERRRIQRNLHDGAQQRITTVLLDLGRLRQAPRDHPELIDSAIEQLSAGLQEIRELARGLHPSVLAERGLVTAVEALAMRASIPTDVLADVRTGLPDQVEAAAYYVVSEGLTNAYKHGGAEKVTIRLHTRSKVLTVEVLDDGIGGADEEGSGLRGLEDRIEALGGTLALESPPGRGTRLLAQLPLP
jgi:signal transduction histidine kinase